MRLLARGTAKAALVVGFGALGLTAALDRPLGERSARADDLKPGLQAAALPAAVTGPLCVLKGTHPVAKGVQIFDAPSAGRLIATFTGADVPLQLRDLPADPTAGRARLSTSLGTASFRIDGYVAASSIPAFTERDISVSGPHLWISSARAVRLVQAASNSLTAELTILGGAGQTVRATAPCDAFSLQKGTPTVMDVPGNGRGYTMKGTSLDLYDEANGSVIFTLKVSEGTSHLFWSTESRAGFVHLRSRADIAVDAWARLRELEPLKKGEMMDALNPTTTTIQSAQLGLDKPPRLVQATKEIPLRARRDDKETPIGAIEVGAEVYVIETVAGWANVLPKHLGLTPPDDGGFWIPASEVPK
jgi:hypothetical protein